MHQAAGPGCPGVRDACAGQRFETGAPSNVGGRLRAVRLAEEQHAVVAGQVAVRLPPEQGGRHLHDGLLDGPLDVAGGLLQGLGRAQLKVPLALGAGAPAPAARAHVGAVAQQDVPILPSPPPCRPRPAGACSGRACAACALSADSGARLGTPSWICSPALRAPASESPGAPAGPPSQAWTLTPPGWPCPCAPSLPLLGLCGPESRNAPSSSVLLASLALQAPDHGRCCCNSRA